MKISLTEGFAFGLFLVLSMLLPFFSNAQGLMVPVRAHDFTDSFGINVHLGNKAGVGAKYYNNWSDIILPALKDLGVKHLRDAAVPWSGTYTVINDRQNEAGRAGIKTSYVITIPTATNGQGPAFWLRLPKIVPDAFEGWEAPNEQGGQLKQDLAATEMLHTATLRWPIVCPSFTKTGQFQAAGDLTKLCDFANLHNYFGGRNPETMGWGSNGYGSYERNLGDAAMSYGGLPVYTTETGYGNASTMINFVSKATAARYYPRAMIMQSKKGIKRTYLYELLTSNGKEDYGLLDSEGNRKPAFIAVQSLLKLLADEVVNFTPHPVNIRIQGGTVYTQSMLFEKSNGKYFLAIWEGAPSYDPDAHTSISVPYAPMLLVMPRGAKLLEKHTFLDSGVVVSTSISPSTVVAYGTGLQVGFTSADFMQIIEFTDAVEPR